MPAEWEPHEATWLAYPHATGDWPGKLDAVRWAFAEFARKLCERESVRMIVRDDAERRHFASRLRRAGGDADSIEYFHCDTDRSWLRDSGPTFALRGSELVAVCWRFDGWGRYADHRKDAGVGRQIAEATGAAVREPVAEGRRVVMEGGAVECNGCGTFLATEQHLARASGNAPGTARAKEGFAAMLGASLGATNVLWLGSGIAGDDTSGHIDTLARFVGPHTVAAAVETDSRDENHAPLRENLRRLRRMRDERGRPLEIAELPMPRPLTYDGARLPASYANFYVGNGCVLAPTFNDPNDAPALSVLEECFPGREVCGIHCVDIALGLGTLHCLAQQQPQAPPGRLRTDPGRAIMGAGGQGYQSPVSRV